jgi:hypothetical protein
MSYKMTRIKKAQVSSQLFLYILAIVIIGLLLVFGVKYIGMLVEKVDTINVVQFKTDLETNIEKIRPNYGTWRILEFDVPVDITEVCFFEYGILPAQPQLMPICLPGNDEYDFIICNAWKDYEYANPEGENPNVFVKPSAIIDTDIIIGRLEIDASEHYLCVPSVGGMIKLKATGLGDGTRIEEWQ